jgi:drug/metabolite transporter (DMT)-like permease
VASQLFDATTGAAAGALLLGAASGGMQLAISTRSLMWLLVLTLASGIVGWLLITASLPHMSPTAAAVVLLLEPAGALVLAGVTLGQRPSLLQLTSAALICAGVLTVVRGKARAAQRGSSPRRPGPRTTASRAN